MANTTIYYPLIKKGFQEVADVSSIESDITQLESDVSSLQSNKVTKCFNDADLAALADEEIFQWQGNNATISGTNFVNGYFYKKTTSQITIASGTFYVNFQNDFITPLFTIPKGYYYYVEDTTINYGYEIQKYFDNILWMSLQPCAIGNPVTSVNGDIAYLTSVNDNYPVSDSLGRSWNNPTQVLSSGTFAKFKNYKTGLELLVALNEPEDSVSSITCFGYLYNELLFPIYDYGWAAIKTTSQTSITEAVFAQTNTQPPTPGIKEENGTLKVSFPVHFEEDVTVKGTQTVVHTEEIESEKDYIELRADNPLGLASSEMSGIKVNNYDGNGRDLVLAVDNKGWARVGDSSDNLQKLATIEETPTNGEFVKYNTKTKQLESSTIPTPPEATQIAAGLMSAADKTKLDGIAVGAQVNPSLSTTEQSRIQLAKYGRLCFLTGNLLYSNSITLPAAYKPSNRVFITGLGPASSDAIFIAQGTINVKGVLAFSQPILYIYGTTIKFNPSQDAFPISFSVAYIAAS